jgi:hypothetical protein
MVSGQPASIQKTSDEDATVRVEKALALFHSVYATSYGSSPVGDVLTRASQARAQAWKAVTDQFPDEAILRAVRTRLSPSAFFFSSGAAGLAGGALLGLATGGPLGLAAGAILGAISAFATSLDQMYPLPAHIGDAVVKGTRDDRKD